MNWALGKPGQFATYNVDMIYDGDRVVAQIYGLPVHQTLKEAQASPENAAALKVARMLTLAPEMRAALRVVYDAIHQLDLTGALPAGDLSRAYTRIQMLLARIDREPN